MASQDSFTNNLCTRKHEQKYFVQVHSKTIKKKAMYNKNVISLPQEILRSCFRAPMLRCFRIHAAMLLCFCASVHLLFCVSVLPCFRAFVPPCFCASVIPCFHAFSCFCASMLPCFPCFPASQPTQYKYLSFMHCSLCFIQETDSFHIMSHTDFTDFTLLCKDTYFFLIVVCSFFIFSHAFLSYSSSPALFSSASNWADLRSLGAPSALPSGSRTLAAVV